MPSRKSEWGKTGNGTNADGVHGEDGGAMVGEVRRSNGMDNGSSLVFPPLGTLLALFSFWL
jgi:hypothetical protein